MEKNITITLPTWIAIKAVELLKKSDPFAVHVRAEVEQLTAQIRTELEKQQKEMDKKNE